MVIRFAYSLPTHSGADWDEDVKQPNDVKRRNPGTPETSSLGRTYRSRGVMTHVSKRFVRNPLSIAAEAASQPFGGPEFVGLPGETYNVGRNAAKRAAKAARLA